MLVRPRESVPRHIPFREHRQAVLSSAGCPGQTIRALDVLTDEVMTAVTEKELDALHDFSLEVNSMISLMEAVGQQNEILSLILIHVTPPPAVEISRVSSIGIPTTLPCPRDQHFGDDLQPGEVAGGLGGSHPYGTSPESSEEGRDDTYHKENSQANRSSSERNSLVDNVWRAIKAIEHDRIVPVLQASSLVIAVFQIPGTLLGEKEGKVPVREALREVWLNRTSTKSCTFQIQCKSFSGVHLNVLHDVVHQQSTKADNPVHVGFTGNQSTVGRWRLCRLPYTDATHCFKLGSFLPSSLFLSTKKVINKK